MSFAHAKAIVGILLVCVTILAVLIGVASIKGRRKDTFNAVIMAQYFVRGKLTAPTRARFNDDKNLQENADGSYTVSGTVEVPNSLGLFSPTHYDCTVQKTDVNSWDIVNERCHVAPSTPPS